jgi:glycine cleavage system protein P-like pyridoxal-binding family
MKYENDITDYIIKSIGDLIMIEIVEILDKYDVEDFDDVLIQIVNTFAEQRKERMEEKR